MGVMGYIGKNPKKWEKIFEIQALEKSRSVGYRVKKQKFRLVHNLTLTLEFVLFIIPTQLITFIGVPVQLKKIQD